MWNRLFYSRHGPALANRTLKSLVVLGTLIESMNGIGPISRFWRTSRTRSWRTKRRPWHSDGGRRGSARRGRRRSTPTRFCRKDSCRRAIWAKERGSDELTSSGRQSEIFTLSRPKELCGQHNLLSHMEQKVVGALGADWARVCRAWRVIAESGRLDFGLPRVRPL